jgi:gas vesicle protein
MTDQPKDSHSSGAGTVMLAFLVGAIAGAAVALLYAPVAVAPSCRVKRAHSKRMVWRE